MCGGRPVAHENATHRYLCGDGLKGKLTAPGRKSTRPGSRAPPVARRDVGWHPEGSHATTAPRPSPCSPTSARSTSSRRPPASATPPSAPRCATARPSAPSPAATSTSSSRPSRSPARSRPAAPSTPSSRSTRRGAAAAWSPPRPGTTGWGSPTRPTGPGRRPRSTCRARRRW
jgi:hypothetical protein